MERSWKIFGYVCAVALLASCSREVENDATIKLQMPSSVVSSKVFHSVNTQNTNGGADWNSSLNPSTVAEVNCYAVFVGGPGLDPNLCGRSDTGEVKFRFGPHRLFIPAGATIELPVPSGPAREIVLAGVKAQNGACQDLTFGGDPDSANMSYPHILSRATVDLQPGEQVVRMTASLNQSDVFDDCDFFDGPGGGGPDGFEPDFGEGTENKTVTTAGSTTGTGTGAFCDVGECGAYGRIDDLNGTLGAYVATMAGSTEAGFAVGDKVMAIVSDAFGGGVSQGPDGYCGDGPGEAFVGSYSEHTITAMSGANITLDGSSSMLDDVLGVPNRATRLAARVGGSDYCYIQLVKIVELNNLTLGVNLTAPSFLTTSDAGGGIIALKIKDTLTLNASAWIDVSGMGNPGGVATVDGVGHGNGTGGKGTASTGGGGGGGHVGPVSFGHPSGGNGGGTPGSGGMAVTQKCSSGDSGCNNEFPKPIFGGGGGGGNATTGGDGGGIVFLHAKNITVGSGSSAIRADGLAGTNDGGSNGGGGGGAGGYIEFFTEHVGGTGNLDITSNGGDGGDAGSGGGSGGGGAGGFVGIASCPHVWGAVSSDNSGGIKGTPSGGPTGDYGEYGRNLYGFLRDPSVCPAGVISKGPSELEYANLNHPASEVKTIELVNAGGAQATNLNTTTVSGTGFQFVGGSFPGTGGSCTAILEPGQSCTLKVELATTGGGAAEHSASLFITYDDAVKGTLGDFVMLEGGEDLAVLEFAVAEHIFGDTATGSTETTLITVQNTGFSNATAMTGFADGDFDFVTGSFPGSGSATCTATLAAGATCTIELEFAPTGTGGRFGRAQLSYHNGVSSDDEDLDLSGNGLAPPIPPDPTALAAPTQSTSSIDLTWTPQGGSTSGFVVTYQSGATAPPDCISGSPTTIGNVSGHTVGGLTAATQYSFRVCAKNSNNDHSPGVTITHTTD